MISDRSFARVCRTRHQARGGDASIHKNEVDTDADRSAQRAQASRINGAGSRRGLRRPRARRSPGSTASRTRLCAVQAVLPGEDPAEFEAHRDALFDDWGPMSYTCAMLVEPPRHRFVAAPPAPSLSESALRARAADDAVRARDDQRQEAVERAVDRASRTTTRAALTLLRSSCPGDWTASPMAAWGELDAALEGGPAGWSQRYHLARLMAPAGPPRRHRPHRRRAAAHGLAAAGGASSGVKPLPKGEARRAAAALRRTAAQAIDLFELHACRHVGGLSSCGRGGPGRHDDAQLRHRYDGAGPLARVLIYQLIALECSGADLPAGPSRPRRPRSRRLRPERPRPERPGRPRSRPDARAPGPEPESPPADPSPTGTARRRAGPARVAGEPGLEPAPSPPRRAPSRGPGGVRRGRFDVLKSAHGYQKDPEPDRVCSARCRPRATAPRSRPTCSVV